MKNISILGVTGSIGTQTLDVIKSQPEDFKLFGVTGNNNFKKMIQIIEEFNPKYVCMMDKNANNIIKDYCHLNNLDIEVTEGMEGLIKVSTLPEIEMVVTSIVGMVGLIPTLNAIKAKKDIALANKETLVVAGELVMKEAEKNQVKILPVDSEHGAIFQCLQGQDSHFINKLLLTASGGPFWGKSRNDLKNISPLDALKHPKWNMGKKVSIDSSTLMNKGLEVIEAHWLFNKDFDKIDVLIHPQSIIHSMIEFIDGSVIAQLGVTDMRLPIQYALNYPVRKKKIVNNLDFNIYKELTFDAPDLEVFPCLKLSYEAGKAGKLMPTILNAANEACVKLFLDNTISFYQLSSIIEECMIKFDYKKEVSLENIIEIDSKVKKYICEKY